MFCRLRRVAVRQDGALSYLLLDHLGSTTAVLADQLQGLPTDVVGEQRYYPYGRTREDAGSGIIPTDKQFTGHQEEGELYYMKARFYDQGLGRFAQADTIVPEPTNPQALNRYAYVVNNPVNLVDPTGRNHHHLPSCFLGMCGGGRTPRLHPGQIRWGLGAALAAVRGFMWLGCTFSGDWSCPTYGGPSGGGVTWRNPANEARRLGMLAARAYIDAQARADWVAGMRAYGAYEEAYQRSLTEANAPPDGGVALPDPQPADCPTVGGVGHGHTVCVYVLPEDEAGCLICDAVSDAAGIAWDNCEYWAWAGSASAVGSAVATGCYAPHADEAWDWATSRSGECYGWSGAGVGIVVAWYFAPEAGGQLLPYSATVGEQIAISCFP